MLPKGKRLSEYTQDDITLLTNHINSTKRMKLQYSSPYEQVRSKSLLYLMEASELKHIPLDEISLSEQLMERRRK